MPQFQSDSQACWVEEKDALGVIELWNDVETSGNILGSHGCRDNAADHGDGFFCRNIG